MEEPVGKPFVASPTAYQAWEERKLAFPREILSMILSRAMDSQPRCALSILAPEWDMCNQETPAATEGMRILTYTRGAEGEVGTFSATTGHGDADHIFVPMRHLDSSIMGIDQFSRDECTRLFFLESTQVFQFTAGGLPADIKDQSFLERWRDVFPLRGKRMRDILPFDDEPTDAPKLKVPGGTSPRFKLLRHLVVNSPLSLLKVNSHTMAEHETGISDETLTALDMAIDLDRASHLWLSWSQMPMLESVLLDLRIYGQHLNTTHGCLSRDSVKKQAVEMGRWLRLKLLVIAGLQSYILETDLAPCTAAQVEEEDEFHGDPNWVKIFMPALRPGGKLVLADRLDDEATPMGDLVCEVSEY
ncbi:hypothetical protein GGS23DRAFT_411029 [Durotheca rogersii]|uniref:uncharacterized protein n=1 Tax=Durotheca rogersii TaxID=419775 RepID=UPI0022205A9E|nr:uncharacterized protein GGS23DRAFT_411029 [Durotheca rogersii]KAI5865135.1 hypothetical protein GGS23DRAFT_411029 [Durotheca rogersii]